MHIEVMLMDNVTKLGKAGAVVKVAPGYARNFLFTHGLAAPVTEAAKRRLKKLEEARAAREAELKKEALETAKKLDNLSFNIAAPTTDGKKLFGSINLNDLIAAIQANRGIEIERSQIILNDALREVGEYRPVIDLGHGVKVPFTVTIADAGQVAE